MTIQIIDGFDLYNGTGANTGLQAKWSLGGSNTPSLGTGRFTGQAISILNTSSGTTGAGYFQRAFPTAIASAGVGFAFKASTLASTQSHYFLTLLDSASGYQLGVKLSSTGALSVDRATGANTGTTLGSTAAGVILTGTWHFIELAVTIHDTTGSVTLKVDGATVLTLTNQDTKNTANTNVQFVLFGHAANSAALTITYSFDDLYVTDGATLGERRVETLRPSADTATKDFTPNTGVTNSTQVDETLADATDYVQASTLNNTDLYDFGDLSSTPATIDAVQLTAFALKTDATSRNIALLAKVSASTSQSSDFALPASAGKFDAIFATKPGGGSWGASDVNAMQAGPKVTL